jgi:hypothetical protein
MKVLGITTADKYDADKARTWTRELGEKLR